MPVSLPRSALRGLASTKATIISISALVVLSLLGTLLPQSSGLSPDELDFWKQDHPLISRVAAPMGAFHMFSSPPFIAVLVLTALNLALNTAVRAGRTRRQLLSKAAATLPVKAHVLVHGGLLLLTVGITLSVLFKLDGSIVLTEGQVFQEGHEAYHSLREGPLFGESHRGYAIRLEAFQPTYESEQFPVRYASRVRIAFGPGDEVETGLEVNHPVKIRGVTLTQDIFGYSPLVEIEKDGRPMTRAFLALNTFKGPQGLRFTDFLQVDDQRRLVFEILPDFNGDYEAPLTRSQVARNPATLVVEEALTGGRWHPVRTRAQAGEAPGAPGADTTAVIPSPGGEGSAFPSGGAARGHGGTVILMGKSGRVGDYVVSFADMRYWTKLRVVEDPYLNVVYAGLWLSLAGLALRYPVAMYLRSRKNRIT